MRKRRRRKRRNWSGQTKIDTVTFETWTLKKIKAKKEYINYTIKEYLLHGMIFLEEF